MAEREAVATELVHRLRAAGHEAYFAGGCVRDRLLGREPLDYDIATSAPPETVQALFPRTVPVGAQFGVVLVVADGMPVEVATLDASRRAASTVTDMAAERIGDEVVKILTEGAARRGFELLAETGLLPAVLPEVARMRGVEQSPDYHPEGDVFRHTLLAIEQLRAGAAETLALGLLLHDVGKPVTAARRNERITFYGHSAVGADLAVAICQRLRRSRTTWERV